MNAGPVDHGTPAQGFSGLPHEQEHEQVEIQGEEGATTARTAEAAQTLLHTEEGVEKPTVQAKVHLDAPSTSEQESAGKTSSFLSKITGNIKKTLSGIKSGAVMFYQTTKAAVHGQYGPQAGTKMERTASKAGEFVGGLIHDAGKKLSQAGKEIKFSAGLGTDAKYKASLEKNLAGKKEELEGLKGKLDKLTEELRQAEQDDAKAVGLGQGDPEKTQEKVKNLKSQVEHLERNVANTADRVSKYEAAVANQPLSLQQKIARVATEKFESIKKEARAELESMKKLGAKEYLKTKGEVLKGRVTESRVGQFARDMKTDIQKGRFVDNQKAILEGIAEKTGLSDIGKEGTLTGRIKDDLGAAAKAAQKVLKGTPRAFEALGRGIKEAMVGKKGEGEEGVQISKGLIGRASELGGSIKAALPSGEDIRGVASSVGKAVLKPFQAIGKFASSLTASNPKKTAEVQPQYSAEESAKLLELAKADAEVRFAAHGDKLGKLSGLAKEVKDAPGNSQTIVFRDGEYTIARKKDVSKEERKETNLQIRRDLDDYIMLATNIGISVTDRPMYVPTSDPTKPAQSTFATLLIRMQSAGVLAEGTAFSQRVLDSYDIRVTAVQFAKEATQIVAGFESEKTQNILSKLLRLSSSTAQEKKFGLKEGATEDTTFAQLVGLEDHPNSIISQAKATKDVENELIANPDAQIKVYLQNLIDKKLLPELANAKQLFQTEVQPLDPFDMEQAIPLVQAKQTELLDEVKRLQVPMDEFKARMEAINQELKASDITEDKAAELKSELAKITPQFNQAKLEFETAQQKHKTFANQVSMPIEVHTGTIEKYKAQISGEVQVDYKANANVASMLINKTVEARTAALGAINKTFADYCKHNFVTTFIPTVALGPIHEKHFAWNAAVASALNKQGLDGENFIKRRKDINDGCELFGKNPTPENFEKLISLIDSFMTDFSPDKIDQKTLHAELDMASTPSYP